ncbi:uncharacterized protein Pyn_41137 [Prunus yedoensis var. nudiflora]|uniref:MULE transposase domain-containing protein n=1 Tax=Prunus yedoensis var. nudiflora TaxID=2094558 RepID=A0A314U740_PRUYE|nr:uncharacterized protein Pyn_41137 [Prunus yedoensis var. nudiflora]
MVSREKGCSQPEYDDKGVVTFEVHHGDWCLLDYINLLEIYAYAKKLGHHDQVVVTGIQNGKKVGLEGRGPIARNLTAEFEQSGYEGMYEEDEEDGIVVDEEDEGDEGTVPEAIHVEEEGDEGTILEGTNVADDRHEGAVPLGSYVVEEGDEGIVPEEGENDKRAENESEDSEDPEFYDSAYEQSEDEQCLLEKDDKAFDNYVDHNALDIDPAADEGEKSDHMVVIDVNSLDSSSCDEVDLPMRKRKRKLPEFEDFRPETDLNNPMLETDLNNPIFKLGLRFPSVYVFRKAVRNYSVFNIRKIKFSKNDKNKVRAVCDGIKNVKCPWFVYASAVNGRSMVQIKSYEDEHTCGTVEHNVHANSSWLAERYERVNEDLCVIASRSQIYRARQKATTELKWTNVGTPVKIKSNLEATKKGFIDALRLVVGLDTCHIKGQQPGQLLSTVGVDPNNSMYTIAYVVAEAENYETWTWFLELLTDDLGIENSNGYVFITDRQKRLIDAVGDMLPNSEHRHCLKHLHSNFILADHRGLVLKQHMEAAARSTTIPWFQAKMKKLQDLSRPAFEFKA